MFLKKADLEKCDAMLELKKWNCKPEVCGIASAKKTTEMKIRMAPCFIITYKTRYDNDVNMWCECVIWWCESAER